MSRPIDSRWARGVCAACVVVVMATLAVTYYRAGALFNQYDDAYITFRYAVNLATGKGLVFNVGEPTDAASSLLYTLLLAACYRVGLHNLELVSTVIGIAAVGGTVAVVFRACRERTDHVGVAAFLACLTGFCGLISGWSMTGMETALFAWLVIATVHVLLVRRRLDWTSTILVCLVALARLEGALLVAAYFGVFCHRVGFRLGPAVGWNEAARTSRRSAWLQAGAVALTIIGFIVIKLCLYRTAIPHAFLFKSISLMYRTNLDFLWAAWRSMALGLLVLGVAGLWAQPRRFESLVLAGYLLVSIASQLVGPSADHARYSAHLVPVLAVLASPLLARMAFLTPSLALGAGALLTTQTVSSYLEMLDYNQSYSVHQDCRKQVGRFIENQLKPKTPVLSSDIGAIAYAAPSASFIDTIALTSGDILMRRAAGQGVDDILQRASDGFVADTCHNACKTFADYSAHSRLLEESAWRTAVPPTAYGRDFVAADPLFICHSPDGLGFAVSRFAPTKPSR